MSTTARPSTPLTGGAGRPPRRGLLRTRRGGAGQVHRGPQVRVDEGVDVGVRRRRSEPRRAVRRSLRPWPATRAVRPCAARVPACRSGRRDGTGVPGRCAAVRSDPCSVGAPRPRAWLEQRHPQVQRRIIGVVAGGSAVGPAQREDLVGLPAVDGLDRACSAPSMAAPPRSVASAGTNASSTAGWSEQRGRPRVRRPRRRPRPDAAPRLGRSRTAAAAEPSRSAPAHSTIRPASTSSGPSGPDTSTPTTRPVASNTTRRADTPVRTSRLGTARRRSEVGHGGVDPDATHDVARHRPDTRRRPCVLVGLGWVTEREARLVERGGDGIGAAEHLDARAPGPRPVAVARPEVEVAAPSARTTPAPSGRTTTRRRHRTTRRSPSRPPDEGAAVDRAATAEQGAAAPTCHGPHGPAPPGTCAPSRRPRRAASTRRAPRRGRRASSVRPASSSSTERVACSLSRAATTAPADPPPTTTTSWAAVVTVDAVTSTAAITGPAAITDVRMAGAMHRPVLSDGSQRVSSSCHGSRPGCHSPRGVRISCPNRAGPPAAPPRLPWTARS